MPPAVVVEQKDGIAGLLMFSSTRSSPIRHEILKVGRSERRRTDDIDVEVTAPHVKTEIRTTTLMARYDCRKSWLPGDALSSRSKDWIKAIANGVMPADYCHIST